MASSECSSAPLKSLMEVTMIRRLAFSSGHRYWDEGLSAEENREKYGAWASRFNHGHNYGLDVAVRGSVDASTGMVVNIKDIDAIARREVLAVYDGKSINDEVPGFDERAPSVETILLDIHRRLADAMPSECRLTALTLHETPLFRGELDATTMDLTLTRTYEFAAAHRLDAPALSPERNIELFGKCNNAAGHGHNYVLEVTVGGAPDPASGMLCSLEELDSLVEALVVNRYDHKNLNEDLPEFAGKSTSSENVTLEIFRRLDGSLPAELRKVRLSETARNLFEVAR